MEEPAWLIRQRAQMLLSGERPQQAMALLLELLGKEGPNPDTYDLLATAARQLHDPEAITYARKAVALEPPNGWRHLRLAEFLLEAGFAGSAIECARRGLELHVSSYAHHVVGRCLMAAGQDADAAVTHFREAVRLAPWSARDHVNLSIALRWQGGTTEADAELDRGLQLAPTDSWILSVAGERHLHAGRLQAAEAALVSSLREDPRQQGVQKGLYEARARKGFLGWVRVNRRRLLWGVWILVVLGGATGGRSPILSGLAWTIACLIILFAWLAGRRTKELRQERRELRRRDRQAGRMHEARLHRSVANNASRTPERRSLGRAVASSLAKGLTDPNTNQRQDRYVAILLAILSAIFLALLLVVPLLQGDGRSLLSAVRVAWILCVGAALRSSWTWATRLARDPAPTLRLTTGRLGGVSMAFFLLWAGVLPLDAALRGNAGLAWGLAGTVLFVTALVSYLAITTPSLRTLAGRAWSRWRGRSTASGDVVAIE